MSNCDIFKSIKYHLALIDCNFNRNKTSSKKLSIIAKSMRKFEEGENNEEDINKLLSKMKDLFRHLTG